MSIQPIDLQVLFARLNLIGREQTNQKNMLMQAQAVAANEIAERSEEEDRRVSDVHPEEDGAEKVSDESDSQQTPQEQNGDHESAEERADQEVLRDPELGQNIDISG
jgi:hypothetical protein